MGFVILLPQKSLCSSLGNGLNNLKALSNGLNTWNSLPAGASTLKKRFCTENLYLKPCLPHSVTVVGWSRLAYNCHGIQTWQLSWQLSGIQKESKKTDLTDWMLPLNKGVNCSWKNKTIDKTQPPPDFTISPVCYNCYSSVLGKRSHYLTLHSVI